MNVKPITPTGVQQWREQVVRVTSRNAAPITVPVKVWDFYPKVKK